MYEDDFLEAQYEDSNGGAVDTAEEDEYDEDEGCEGHEATTCGRYNGPIGETVYCDGSCRA